TVNLGHLKVSIENTDSQDIIILTWNPHFQSDAEHSSFNVTYNLDETEVKLQPGEDMVQYNFIEPVSSDLVKISAGGQHDSYHDLTRLFMVPIAGKYQVALELATPAVLHCNGPTLEEVLKKADPQARDLLSLKIQSAPREMGLGRTQPTLQRGAGDSDRVTAKVIKMSPMPETFPKI
ncbi:MAG: hypothetical protein L6R36_005584, partial [Xanthoria steineri]